jgi:hypothetical protein
VGIVEFRSQPEGRIAKGKIDQLGKFQLSTFDVDDGAVAGTHQVVVIQHFDPKVWSRQKRNDRVLSSEHAQHGDDSVLVHRQYAKYESSGLTAVVKPQVDNPIELVVGTPVELPK